LDQALVVVTVRNLLEQAHHVLSQEHVSECPLRIRLQNPLLVCVCACVRACVRVWCASE